MGDNDEGAYADTREDRKADAEKAQGSLPWLRQERYPHEREGAGCVRVRRARLWIVATGSGQRNSIT